MATVNIFDMADTWNNVATTYTAIKMNVTDTASNASSLLMDLQVGGVSRVRVSKSADLTVVGVSATNASFVALNDSSVSSSFGTGRSGFGPYSGKTLISNSSNNPIIINTSGGLDSNGPISLNVNSAGAVGDVILTRKAAASLRLGAADAASPVAQTLGVQSVVAGTTNTAGANFTIAGSQGTGTGAGGSIIFQVAPAGSSGTAQNALSTALTIASNRSITLAAGSATLKQGATANYLIYENAGLDVLQVTGGEFNLVGNALLTWGTTNNTFTGYTADTILRRDAANTLALRNGTNAQELRVYKTTTGTVYKALLGDNNLIKIAGEAFTDGAGANTGTLTNSPVTGNPTKWIPIDDNGTTRYIPAW